MNSTTSTSRQAAPRFLQGAAQGLTARLPQVDLNPRQIVELALAAALAVPAAITVWLMVTPAGPFGQPLNPSASEPDLAALSRIDAFFRVGSQSSLAAATAENSAHLRLFGVRAGGVGGGSAIIGTPDGRQTSVLIGQEVESGVILHAVANDHVVLARGASRVRLAFAEAPPAATPPPPPPATPQVLSPTGPSAASAAGPAVGAEAFARQAALTPRRVDGRIQGFILQARGDGAMLRTAGLQPGDVILSVNGVAMNSVERASELPAELANATSATIRYERDGQEGTTTVRIDR